MSSNESSGTRHAGISDDIRQSFVICENEIKKFFRGKKLQIFGVLILLVTALISALPYIFGDSYDETILAEMAFVAYLAIIIELAVVLFTATSLVSEFEDRTALILFTKPVKKWVIFFGKLAASLIVIIVFTVLFYGYIAIFSYLATGGVDYELIPSLGQSVCAIFGMSGIAMMMSAIAKKGSTASIMTLVMLILVIGLIASLLNASADIPTWWAITEEMNAIIYALPYDPGYFDTEWSSFELMRAACVNIAWGVVLNTAAFLAFRKRDF